MLEKQTVTNIKKIQLNWTAILVVSIAFACAAFGALLSLLIPNTTAVVDEATTQAPTEPPQYSLMENFDSIIGNALEDAHQAATSVKKVFWIPEDTELAPLPNAQCYGETDDPSTLQWLLDDATELLDGQAAHFSTDIEIYPGSVVTYYLDESIFVITWQQLIDNFVYTFSEVKISHPSQFRRYLAHNEYDSGYLYTVSRMCSMSNAVMAASADFYRGRNHGIIVYQGEVKRTDYSEMVDTCFIDDQGDLILVPAGELIGVEAAQTFVDEHNIDFSIAFGPILVQDGVRCEPQAYLLGEINLTYPRAALCQKDKLHYIVVIANGKDGYWQRPTIHDFANRIDELDCLHAYALDGGKTGTVAMRGKALNPVQGTEREISDIILFATAIPSEEPPAEETQP